MRQLQYALLLLAGATCIAPVSAADLSGTVRDAEGQSIADARVWLWQSESVATGTTGADGAFTFDQLAVGIFTVVVLHDDFALDGFTGFAAGDATLEILLRPAATQTIHVVDDGFQNLAGARIHRLSVEGRVDVPVNDLVPHGFPELRSGDDGVIAIAHLPENGFIRLVVRHFRYADTYVPFMPVRGTTDDVQLIPGIRIAGRVTRPPGAIADAQVIVYRLTPQGQQEVATTRSDADGLYSARVAPGPYLIAVRHAEFAPAPPRKIEVAEGDEPPAFDFTLAPPRSITGSVLGPKNVPIPAARIQWLKDEVIYDETFTNAQGEYRLSVADPKGLLRILPPTGYMTEGLGYIPVDMGDKDTVPISATYLVPLPVIEGTVADQDGTPVPRALVSTTNLESPLWFVCDEEGRFHAQLWEMPEVQTITFQAEHPLRFQRAEFEIKTQKAKAVEVNLKTYTPDATSPKQEGPGNDLSKLLGEAAPAFDCREWFNFSAEEAGDTALLKDKVTVLIFWGGFAQNTPGPNRIEQVRALQAVLEGVDNVQILSIHDASSEAAEVEQYIEDFGVTFPVGLDANPFVTFDRYNINFIPDIILIDKDGKVAHTEVEDRLLELIKVLRR